MRIGELSRTTGTGVATLKFYLREGLLPAGVATRAPNQADYDSGHVHRLYLVRALLQIGGMGVAAARDVLAAIDDRGVGLVDLLAVAHRALPIGRGRAAGSESADSADLARARAEIDDFLDARGWELPACPARDELAAQLAGALVALRRLGRDVDAEVFTPYADLMDGLARDEVAWLTPESGRERLVEDMVIGTVVFETALVALRRLAHERHSTLRFG